MFASRSFSNVGVAAEVMASGRSHTFSLENMTYLRSSAVRPRSPSKAASGDGSMQVVSFRSASTAGSQAKRDGSAVKN